MIATIIASLFNPPSAFLRDIAQPFQSESETDCFCVFPWLSRVYGNSFCNNHCNNLTYSLSNQTKAEISPPRCHLRPWAILLSRRHHNHTPQRQILKVCVLWLLQRWLYSDYDTDMAPTIAARKTNVSAARVEAHKTARKTPVPKPGKKVGARKKGGKKSGGRTMKPGMVKRPYRYRPGSMLWQWLSLFPYDTNEF